MQLFHQDIMDCPNCGRRGLVQQNNSIYQCLCCGFRRNLSEPMLDERVLWAVVILILMTFVLGDLQPEDTLNEPQPQLQSLNHLSNPVSFI